MSLVYLPSQHIDNGKTVSVVMNNGVKPKQINLLGAKAVKAELTACELDKLKKIEDDFSEKLLSENPKTNFTITEIKNFQWKTVLKNDYIKTDILNKNKSISKIEVLDIHSTHRCMTCNAIEANTKYTLNTYFATKLKEDKITFVINVDENENEKIAENLKHLELP